MADYKESLVSGTSWQRAYKVVINNPYGGKPSIMFQEERVVNTDGVITATPVAEVTCAFDVTREGHVALYTDLNTLYMELALARDTKDAEVCIEPVPQPDSEVTI